MPTPGEHKPVQARILAYAQEIGWRYVPRAEAEARRWKRIQSRRKRIERKEFLLFFAFLAFFAVRPKKEVLS